MKLLSWNVNGIRAVLGKNFSDYLQSCGADVLCIQETKASPDQVDLPLPHGYSAYWNSAVKKGYSGTCAITRVPPIAIHRGIGKNEHDSEGRVLTLEFDRFMLVNVYTPNSQDELRRLDYRTREWDVAFLDYLQRLERHKPVVCCGDLNVAHQEIDLANPKSNRRNAGFTDEERAGFQRLLDAGFVDTFRVFNQQPGQYTWWSYRGGARSRNVGWRIDYFLVSGALRPALRTAWIEPQVMGSDHCPVGLELEDTSP